LDAKTATEVASNIVTSAAVTIGGIWAYFKFIRGRTFARRAELNVSSTLKQNAKSMHLSVTVTLKNAGLSKLPLNENMKAIRLFEMARDGDNYPAAVKWERVLTLPILRQHAWLEAQEAVTDTIIYNLGPADVILPDHIAYRVEAVVGSPRRKFTGKGTLWRAHSIIFLQPDNPVERGPEGAPAIAGGN
jgi:hypothetical protein